MFSYIFIAFLLIFVLLAPIIEPSLMHIRSIFQDNPCKIKCKNTSVHTLCLETTNISCPGYFKTYFVSELSHIEFKRRLLYGHNGLRNRIATRMMVANMVEMTWSVELEEMARNYFYYCTPFEDDKCTQFYEYLTIEEKFHAFTTVLNGWKHVVQNRYCIFSEFFPRDYVELAMRTWYFGKSKLKRPFIYLDKVSQKILGRIDAENNFTHIAYPLGYRFGCALARVYKNYCINCFYYPYFYGVNKSFTFFHGEPGSLCPAYFPLKDQNFNALCTGDYERDNSSNKMLLTNIWIFIGLFIFLIGCNFIFL